MKSKRAKPHAKRAPPSPSGQSLSYVRQWLLAMLAAVVVARPLLPSEGVSWMGDDLPFAMLLFVVALCACLWATARGGFLRSFNAIDGCVMALVVACVTSALVAASDANPRLVINMLWFWAGMGLVYLLARQLVRTEQETRALVVVMVALAVVLSVFGFYQVLVSLPADRAAYAADPEQVMLRSLGQVYPVGSPERLRFEDRLHSTEPLATFALANSLAGLLAAWLIVALGIAWSMINPARSDAESAAGETPRASSLGMPGGLGLAVCIVAIASCLLLTKSRSALVAAALGGALVPFSQARSHLNWKLLLAGAATLLVMIALAFAAGGLDVQVLSEASKSLGFRLQYWRSTLSMIAAHPLLGVGPGNFQDYYTQFKLPQASEEIRDPHNFLLEVWATGGTFALAALAAALGLLAARVLRAGTANSSTGEVPPSQKTGGPMRSTGFIVAGGATGLGVAFLIAPLFGYSLSEGQLACGLLLGAAVVAILWPWIARGSLPPRLLGVGLLVLCVHLLAAGGVTFPGVAGSFWILFALALNRTEAEPPEIVIGPRKPLTQILPIAGAVLVCAAGVACYYTAFHPVLRFQETMAEVAKISHPQARVVAMLDAAAADPLSAEPWIAIAELQLEKMQKDREPTASYQHFLAAADRVKDLRSHSSAAWRQLAHWYLAAYERNHSDKAISSAIECLRTAVALYPNSAILRAELALALQLEGKTQTAARQAERALELDDQMPHADKKLPAETRARIESLRSEASPQQEPDSP
jgi:hypothetical protein